MSYLHYAQWLNRYKISGEKCRLLSLYLCNHLLLTFRLNCLFLPSSCSKLSQSKILHYGDKSNLARVLSNEQLSEGSRLPNANVAKDWKWEIKYCHNSTMTVLVASLRYRFLNLEHRTPFLKSTSTVHAMLTVSRVCYLLALGEFQTGLCRPIWNIIR